MPNGLLSLLLLDEERDERALGGLTLANMKRGEGPIFASAQAAPSGKDIVYPPRGGEYMGVLVGVQYQSEPVDVLRGKRGVKLFSICIAVPGNCAAEELGAANNGVDE